MKSFIKKNLEKIYRSQDLDFNRDEYVTLDKNESSDSLNKSILNKFKKINFSKRIKLYPSLQEIYKLISKNLKLILKISC